ncbi:DUF6543 domain-containing protein [Pseudomonas donghuensis]|uniref:DUF6543 domain-containing protein n=1 Tax=Pseudomonas donghuensis TaxID=1163398 RepID=UPI00029B1650|nr:DUF6543 domain-containing protein [Pseudomonas donghuensis]
MDLAPQLEANALGQYELRDQHYIRLDSELLRQYFDPYTREWRIVHPQDATAYQPVLVHNRQGAWRHVHERPLGWSRATLLRRLGYPVEAYIDRQHCLRCLQVARDSEVLPAHLSDLTREQNFSRFYQGPPASLSPQQLALPRAMEGLYEPLLANDDGERLVFACLKRLHHWPTGATASHYLPPGRP